MDVVQLQRVAEGEDVLGAIVPRERLADGLLRGGAPDVAVLGQRVGRVVAGDDGPDDAHARDARDVGDDVVQLDVHLHERLLHVLNVRGGVLDEPFAMAQVGAQPDDPVARAEAAPEQPVLMELLQPLRIVHVGLAARDMLDVARVHQEHLEAARLENLEHRNPVHARRLHGDGRDADLREPVGQADADRR